MSSPSYFNDRIGISSKKYVTQLVLYSESGYVEILATKTIFFIIIVTKNKFKGHTYLWIILSIFVDYIAI